MKPRVVLFILVASLGATSSARAAIPTPTGTLTVLSRPPGVAFEIKGAVEISGRTPLTLTPRVTGRYELRSTEPGYNTWRRVLTFDGISPDTVWMSLSRKSAAGAGLRSAIVPGWGQYYSGRPGSGTLFLGAAVLAGAGFELTRQRYRSREDAVDQDYVRLNASTTPAQIAAARTTLERDAGDRDQALHQRRVAQGVLGGVWAISFIETLTRFPAASKKAVSLELAPAGLSANSGALAALRVRF